MSEMIGISIAFTLLTVISTILRFIRDRREKRKTEEKTTEKIDKLSDLLKSASSEIEKMEKELKKKRKTVEDLERQKRDFETLISLRQEQVEVLKKEISSILGKHRRTSMVWTIAIGAMWFILGLILRGMLGF